MASPLLVARPDPNTAPCASRPTQKNGQNPSVRQLRDVAEDYLADSRLRFRGVTFAEYAIGHVALSLAVWTLVRTCNVFRANEAIASGLYMRDDLTTIFGKGSIGTLIA